MIFMKYTNFYLCYNDDKHRIELHSPADKQLASDLLTRYALVHIVRAIFFANVKRTKSEKRFYSKFNIFFFIFDTGQGKFSSLLQGSDCRAGCHKDNRGCPG